MNLLSAVSLALLTLALPGQEKQWITYEGKSGPGHGKHVVFLTGDEEYRSEEGLPELARILAYRHGFKCTVLFSVGKQGFIDPNTKDNEPGIEALDSADLCIMLLRFRQWPDGQMKHFVDYYLAGKPIIALRTSTHAFDYPESSTSPYARFGWRSKEWKGGFGGEVLGETWVSHWGLHGVQATRGVVQPGAAIHPVLQGVTALFGTTDVYEAAPPSDSQILVRGQVLSGMQRTDQPAIGRKKAAKGVEQDLNDPMMPLVWLRRRTNEAGRVNRILTCTMGAATDLLDEGLRRLLVNGAYWAIGMDARIPKRANVDIVGPFQPSNFGFEGFRKGVKPADLAGRG